MWFQTRFLKFSCPKPIFSLCDVDMQRPEPFEQLLKRAIKGSFLPSLVQIQPVVKEEMSFEAIVDDGRLTAMYAGHPTITIAHHEPKAQVS